MPNEKEPKEELTKEEKKELELPGKDDRESEVPPERELRLDELEGLFSVVDYVPTKVPTHFSEQIVIYKSGTTYRVYAYISDAWKKIYDSVVPSTVFASKSRAYLTTTDQTIGTSSETKVTLNAEDFDINSEFDHSTNYRFTAKAAGYYQVNAIVTWSDSSHQYGHSARIKKNTTAIAYAYSQGLDTNDYVSTQISDIVSMSANDYLELFVWHNKGSNADILAGTDKTYMSVHRIS